MYDINEFLADSMPIICVPLFILILNTVFRIVKLLCQGDWIIENTKKSEPIRAEPPKVNLKKDTLDSDLKKYFNYDVKSNRKEK